MIKLFEQYNEYRQVKEWLDRMEIFNYTINDDLTVDVDNDVIIKNYKLTEIPIQFGKVTGDFRCDDNSITSLKGCPSEVFGNFTCKGNNLTSLEHSPIYVGMEYNCNRNKLITLKGCPDKIIEDFFCMYNELTTLEYGPKEVNGYYGCAHNNLTTLKGIPVCINGDLNCSHNNLVTLEYGPKEMKGDFFFNNNSLISLKHIPKDIDGYVYYADNKTLPKCISKLDKLDKIKILLKYQDEYGVWNSDYSLNMNRYNLLLNDYENGVFNND